MFFIYAIIVEIIIIISNIIAEYDIYIIAYTSQHDADTIPINLIIFSSLFKKDIKVIRHANTGNIENIFSYEKYDIAINKGINVNTNIFFFFSLFENKYINISDIKPSILHIVPDLALSKK